MLPASFKFAVYNQHQAPLLLRSPSIFLCFELKTRKNGGAAEKKKRAGLLYIGNLTDADSIMKPLQLIVINCSGCFKMFRLS